MMKIVVLALLVVLALGDVNVTSPLNKCGGNCPSNDCGSCPCGTTRSPQDVDALCQKYSWDQKCCTCIARHESGGNANAVNQNTGGSLDVGVWQINSANWGQCSGGAAPCDPATNLQCAIDVYNWGGGSFKLWSTCNACGCCNPPPPSTTYSMEGDFFGKKAGGDGDIPKEQVEAFKL